MNGSGVSQCIAEDDGDDETFYQTLFIPAAHRLHRRQGALTRWLSRFQAEYFYRITAQGTTVDLFFDPVSWSEDGEVIQRALADGVRDITHDVVEDGSEAANPSPSDRQPKQWFPFLWALFPIVLPRAVRERVYDPAHEELKEDYVRERARWTGWFPRTWVTFCFTLHTGRLVFLSGWAATSRPLRACFLLMLATLFMGGGGFGLAKQFIVWVVRLI